MVVSHFERRAYVVYSRVRCWGSSWV